MTCVLDSDNLYKNFIAKTRDKNILFNLDWELTRRCNEKCIHCYQGYSNDSVSELSTNKIYRVLDELADMGTLFLTFTGGEALLREDFLEIAEYARRKNFALRLFTNGTCIDEEKAKKLTALNFISIELSVYAMTADLHDEVTQVKGSFLKTMRAIELLKSFGARVAVKTIAMKKTFNDFDKIKNFAKENNMRFVYTELISPEISGNKRPCAYALDDSQRKEWLRKTCPDKKLLKERIALNAFDYDCRCSAAMNAAYITAEGNFSPCVLLALPAGSVLNNSVKELWNSRVFENIRKAKVSDLKECKECPDFAFCSRCPGIAFLEKANMLASASLYCKRASYMREYYEEAKEEEYAGKEGI